ncbi:hypothetical protein NPIL_107471 [Nephila pilipes]|uniref:Uncharacterized protein n=1 Tax=Nephila pilipes TaxID=299642 RepID=A0A8X6U8R3_NEPPI|nr:hypothetical protein NPIL_107471 [Nephila pilipes]
MCLTFFKLSSECDIDRLPEWSSSSALPEHLVLAINHILGHGIITISFPQRTNGLGASFLELNKKTLCRSTGPRNSAS